MYVHIYIYMYIVYILAQTERFVGWSRAKWRREVERQHVTSTVPSAREEGEGEEAGGVRVHGEMPVHIFGATAGTALVLGAAPEH